MPDLAQYSYENLAARRHDLKRRRQRLFWQRLWRHTALVGIAVGCVSLATSGRWQLQSAEQINLSG